VKREADYVLGTHDEEIDRLGLQHRVWRPYVLAAWQRAGFSLGQTILDVGCGPGYASLDLAETVGSRGRVLSLDRSRRFLDVLEEASRARGLARVIQTFEVDLDEGPLPDVAAQGAWFRWVLAFVQRPRELLERVVRALEPGGRLVIFEYIDYATWRMAPRSAEHEEFVREVMTAWRASGGEPDIGLEVPRWLEELGCEVIHLNPIMEVITPTDPMWLWPRRFIESGRRRMVELGRITPERAAEMDRAFEAMESAPGTRMITPAVIEIVARAASARSRALTDRG
jgi:SAM-dependent methyltransferase